MNETVRPERAGGGAARPSAEPTLLPTVREVLRMDAVAGALPEVLAGEERLDHRVRWVHVAETAAAARLVSGGELLLATGVGWPTDAASLRRLGTQLATADIAGLVLELGARMPAAPEPLVAEFRAAQRPFVVLHREARFVEITEAVHSRIVDHQMVALRARDDIHALFTGLSLRGSPADYIVAQAARVLGCPVVLEDTGHQVVAAENLGVEPAGATERELERWEQRSRAAHRSVGEPGWTITPVEARGMRWGHLIALPGEPHPAGRSTVLEQAAVALALSRLADRDDGEWVRRRHDSLLRALIGRRFAAEAGMSARFEAAGFPIADRQLIGAALRTRAGLVSPRALTRVLTAASTAGVDGIAAAHPAFPGTIVLALSARNGRAFDDAFFASLIEAAGSSSVGAGGVVAGVEAAGVGEENRGVTGLLASVEEALHLLDRDAGGRTRQPILQRAQQRPLLRLVTALGNDPRLLEHSEQMLRPLIEHDLANEGDLVEVLRAYLRHPGNRTRAAAASHLSRSVFYQRIALIEDLLELDLDEGETIAALHAAVLARTR